MSDLPFEPGASLARVAVTPVGFVIDCRGPRVCQHYDFRSAGETAEMALILRDQGGWPLRYSAGAKVVEYLVDELTAARAP